MDSISTHVQWARPMMELLHPAHPQHHPLINPLFQYVNEQNALKKYNKPQIIQYTSC